MKWVFISEKQGCTSSSWGNDENFSMLIPDTALQHERKVNFRARNSSLTQKVIEGGQTEGWSCLALDTWDDSIATQTSVGLKGDYKIDLSAHLKWMMNKII
jgi:hypothetical protein